MGVREADLSRSRIVAAVGGASAAAVLILAVLATLSISSSGIELWRVPFRMMCHGQVDRAFEIAGTAMPICARCTGIYTGMIVGALWLFLAPFERREKLRFVAGLAIALPMVVDGFMQMFGVWATGNLPRSLTGLFFGIGLVLIAGNALAPEEGEGAPEPAI